MGRSQELEYEIGWGSEVRIEGGRILGMAKRNDGSIGVLFCTGYNGGVHIDTTDINSVETGLLLDNSNGKGSNREIFIHQATFDSSGRGIAVKDQSYIDISGCWAASSDTDQIWVGTQFGCLRRKPIACDQWCHYF